MINLLPPDYKEQIAYSKRNRSLVSVFIFFASVVAVMIIILMSGRMLIGNQVKNLEQESQLLQDEISTFGSDLAQAKSLSNKINTLGQLFEQESRYSLFIEELAGVTPSWARLNNLNLLRNEEAEDDLVLNVSYELENIKQAATLRENLVSLGRVDNVDVQNASLNSETGIATAGYVIGLNTPAHQPLEPETADE